MAKISLANSGKYSSGATNDFFTLADDGDIARVRFLYEEPDGSDVDYFQTIVHYVKQVTIELKNYSYKCM